MLIMKSIPKKVIAFLKALGAKVGMPEDEVEKLLDVTAEDGSDGVNNDGGDDGDRLMPFDVTKLDPEAQAAFKALEGERDTAVAEVEKLTDPEGDVSKLPPDVPENIQKLFDGLSNRVEKAETRATDAESKVEKMEDAQIDREFIQKTARLTSMPGVSPDDFAGVYRKAVEGMTDEHVDRLLEWAAELRNGRA